MATIIAFEVYAGRARDHVVQCKLNDVALDITGCTLTFTVRRQRDDTAVLLTMTTPVQIEVTSATNGMTVFHFIGSLTQGRAGLYIGRLDVLLTTGQTLMLEEGPVTILP